MKISYICLLIIFYMKTYILKSLLLFLLYELAFSVYSQRHNWPPEIRHDVPRDSIYMSDPSILADEKTGTYYMTGTGGLLWKSKDLDTWSGPYVVAQPDTNSWMGRHPMIWAAEIHPYKDKYYYFATFTNNSNIILKNHEGIDVPRRASHILVSDSPEGPYLPVSVKDYLPDFRPTLDGTFWIEPDGKPYMVFCGEWLYDNDGTMEAIELLPDLSSCIGEPYLLFKASDSPWSRDSKDGVIKPNRVTDGPYLFRTGTGKLGMIWTSWIDADYTMGVAYSENGTVLGPWQHEPDPIMPPNYGHGMIFTDFTGRNLLSLHSHVDNGGRFIRRPTLWEVDLTGDKLKIIKKIEKANALKE